MKLTRPYEGFDEIYPWISRGTAFTCQVCGARQVFGERALMAHHKNGDNTDMCPENLAAVCYSCLRRLHPRGRVLTMEEVKK